MRTKKPSGKQWKWVVLALCYMTTAYNWVLNCCFLAQIYPVLPCKISHRSCTPAMSAAPLLRTPNGITGGPRKSITMPVLGTACAFQSSRCAVAKWQSDLCIQCIPPHFLHRLFMKRYFLTLDLYRLNQRLLARHKWQKTCADNSKLDTVLFDWLSRSLGSFPPRKQEH